MNEESRLGSDGRNRLKHPHVCGVDQVEDVGVVTKLVFDVPVRRGVEGIVESRICRDVRSARRLK